MAGRKQDFDVLIKLLLIGDSGVGKSCLLLRFSEDSFTSSFITTIGIDFKVKKINIDGRSIKLQIWDTAGQERFRTITSAYYRGAMGILLVYDITDMASFNNVRNWVRNIEQHTDSSVNKVLVGNKLDLEAKRMVPRATGQALADEFGFTFIEASAKENINVEELFVGLARDVLRRQAAEENAAQQAAGLAPGGAPGPGGPRAGGAIVLGEGGGKAAGKANCCS